jgi:hypothetical protein
MASTDADTVTRAIIADSVHKIAELAAACAVNPKAVSAVAAAHGDQCFAETVDAGMTALGALRGKSTAAFSALRKLYTTTAMIDIIERSIEKPIADEMQHTIAVGGHVFRTSKSQLLVNVWIVHNPGTAIVALFCDGLGATQGDLTDPNDFVDSFNASVPKTALSHHVAQVCASIKFVDEHLT